MSGQDPEPDSKTPRSSPPARGKLVVIAGIDGAGKTATVQALADGMAGTHHNIWPVDSRRPVFSHSYVEEQRQRLAAILWDPDKPQDRLGHRYYHYIKSAFFEMVDRCCINPALDSGKLVIIDNWYYKDAARASLRRDISLSQERALSESLTKPDLTVLLDLPPSVAASRKATFTPTETGRNDGISSGGRDGFIEYQLIIRKTLLELIPENACHVIPVAGMEVGEVAQAVMANIPSDWLPNTSMLTKF